MSEQAMCALLTEFRDSTHHVAPRPSPLLLNRAVLLNTASLPRHPELGNANNRAPEPPAQLAADVLLHFYIGLAVTGHFVDIPRGEGIDALSPQ